MEDAPLVPGPLVDSQVLSRVMGSPLTTGKFVSCRAAVFLSAFLVFLVSAPSSSATPQHGLTGVNVLGWELNDPSSMIVSGQRLFEINYGNAVWMLNKATGALAKTIPCSGASFAPDAVAVDGPDLFLANGDWRSGHGDTIRVLNAATGALVRLISGPEAELAAPDLLTVSGPDLFVATNPAGRAGSSPS